MAPWRIICDPTECCVQPSAYMIVMARVGVAVDAMISQIWRNLSCGVPQTRVTISGVYRA